MTTPTIRPLSVQDLEQTYPIDEFRDALSKFIEQVTLNKISKTTKGSKREYTLTTGARLDNHYGQGAASRAPYLNYWWISIYWNTLSDVIVLAAYPESPDIRNERSERLMAGLPVRYTDMPGKGKVLELFSCKKDELDNKLDDLHSKFMQAISVMDAFEITHNPNGRYVGDGWRDKMLGIKVSRRSAPRLYDKIATNLAASTDDEIVEQIVDEDANIEEITATLEALANTQPPERVERIVIKVVRNPRIARLIKERQSYVCEACGREPFMQKNGKLYAEADHITPLGLGGLDTPENMRCLCSQCHAVITHGADRVIRELLEAR